MSSKPTVCVIGAGKAGLCALRHALANDMDVVAYEQMQRIGGTWVYEQEETNSREVHSSLYEDLRTNLPKEVMGFPDFPYPQTDNEDSYIGAIDVLEFIESYAKHFQLLNYIKFEHDVIRVRPKCNKWEVIVRDLTTDSYELKIFDFVFVCNGHYTMPQYPDISGMNVFKGKQLHSHSYRRAEDFEDETILVIGCGSSGIDIAYHTSKKATQVYFSHHLDPAPDISHITNAIHTPDVERFTEDGAIFKDGSAAKFNTVIYCTGYKFSFPFLSSDCGIHVEDNFVQPLYKHCINIDYPTMALIGLPIKVIPTQLFDMQVRFALKFFTQRKKLPDRKEMLADQEAEQEQRRCMGLNKRQAHYMGIAQFDYYRDLSRIAEIDNIKPVIEKIMKFCGKKLIYEAATYRSRRFQILDDDNFVQYM